MCAYVLCGFFTPLCDPVLSLYACCVKCLEHFWKKVGSVAANPLKAEASFFYSLASRVYLLPANAFKIHLKYNTIYVCWSTQQACIDDHVLFILVTPAEPLQGTRSFLVCSFLLACADKRNCPAEAVYSTNIGRGGWSICHFKEWKVCDCVCRRLEEYLCAGRFLYNLLGPHVIRAESAPRHWKIVLSFRHCFVRQFPGINVMIKYIGTHLILSRALADILGFFGEQLGWNGEKKPVAEFPAESYLLLRVCRGFCLLLQIILSESALTWPSKAAYLEVGGPVYCWRPLIMAGLVIADRWHPQNMSVCDGWLPHKPAAQPQGWVLWLFSQTFFLDVRRFPVIFKFVCLYDMSPFVTTHPSHSLVLSQSLGAEAVIEI